VFGLLQARGDGHGVRIRKLCRSGHSGGGCTTRHLEAAAWISSAWISSHAACTAPASINAACLASAKAACPRSALCWLQASGRFWSSMWETPKASICTQPRLLCTQWAASRRETGKREAGQLKPRVPATDRIMYQLAWAVRVQRFTLRYLLSVCFENLRKRCSYNIVIAVLDASWTLSGIQLLANKNQNPA